MLIHRKVKLCDLLLRSPNKRQSPGLGGRTSSISVADIRGGNRRNNSSVQLNHLFTYEAPASPTLTAQRRRESSSPENVLKPRHFVHT